MTEQVIDKVEDPNSFTSKLSTVAPSTEKAEPLNTVELESGSKDESANEEVNERESWNNPPQNTFRLMACYYGFIVFGMSDSSIGVLLPDLEAFYGVSYLIVSIAFLAPFTGYLVAALLSDHMHRYLGRWGVSMFGTGCQLVCYIIAITAPPFPVYVIGYGIAGFGNGMLEAAWNSWMSNLNHANQVMGILHGCYGLGGILCPAIFTAMIGAGKRWNVCYSVMIAMSSLSVMLSTSSFWGDTPKRYIMGVEKSKAEGGHTNSSISQVVKNKLVWILSLVLFLYVGGEVAFGGWITTFMIVVRNGNKDKMGYVTTGFWTGLTVGRMTLGFVTGYIKHEDMLVAIYLCLSIAFILLFWLVPVLVASALFAALFGFCIGPLFPTVVVVAVQKLPKWLHVSGVGFSAALGGAGAAIIPFINGVVANDFGPKVVGPFVFSLFAAMFLTWLVVLKFF